MTDEEVSNVKDAAEIIKTYKTMYEKQKEYNANSIIQRLDPYAIKTLVLTYYVDNNFVPTNVLDTNTELSAIIGVYASHLSKDSIYANISEKVDKTVSPAYYREVITIDTESSANGVFSITVYALSQDALSQIGEILKSEIDETTSFVVDTYGDISLKLTSEVIKNTIDADMATVQQENIQKMTDITAAIKTEESAFTGNQLNYLRALVHEGHTTGTNVAKFVFIGAVLGAVLAAGLYCIKYCTSDSIKTFEEFEGRFGINAINLNSELAATKISILAKQANMKSIAVLTDSNLDVSELISFVSDVEISVVDGVTSNKNAMRDMVSYDGVVIAFKVGESSKNTIADEIRLCKDYKVSILGGVAI